MCGTELDQTWFERRLALSGIRRYQRYADEVAMPVTQKPSERPEDPVDAIYGVRISSHRLVVVRHTRAWRPPTDVIEAQDRLIVVVEVAGMGEGEFHITVDDRLLVITGNRPPAERLTAAQNLAFHQLEVHYGEFRTEVGLPWAVDPDLVVARYEDGFLTIELPRAASIGRHVVRVTR